MLVLAQAAFWAAALLLAYTYLGYPVVMWLWSRILPRAERRGSRLPTVSIVTVAQNEAAQIEARIFDLLSLHYPRDRVEIVIASDGSSDDTVRRARAYQSPRVRVLAFPRPRGKAATLCDAVAATRGDILLFCDVRQRIAPEALQTMVGRFADPRVGVVSGTLVYGSARSSLGRGMGAYWRWETFVRSCESRVHSMLGATGALYAMRRELFEPIPPDTLLDDVVIPSRALRRGYRIVFEPSARAIDEAPASARHELGRKVRTLTGCFQLFARESWLLHPLKNRIWIQTLSHKGLRLCGPILLFAALVASALLSASPAYRAVLGLQLGFYALAFAGLVAQRRVGLLGVPYTFCLLQVAALLALGRFIAGTQTVLWKGPAGEEKQDVP